MLWTRASTQPSSRAQTVAAAAARRCPKTRAGLIHADRFRLALVAGLMERRLPPLRQGFAILVASG